MSKHVRELREAIGKKSKEMFQNTRVKHVLHVVLQLLLGVGILLGGKEVAEIAAGRIPGLSPNILPATLPLLLSGTLYIDRFAAVFCVILAAVLLVELLRGGRGVIKEGLRTGVITLGAIAAATPLTLVAWILLLACVEVGRVPKKHQPFFLLSLGALGLSVLLFSGGAFLADMTIVATISSQLPQGLTLLALSLLFGGALMSMRDLRGAYALIPAYTMLRISLFFLGPISATFLTLVSLIAIIAALLFAQKNEGALAHTKSSLFLLFAAVPFTMIAVQMQNITAVQCFLFGGLFIAAAGLLMDASGVWPQGWKRGGTIYMRILGSPLPGTAMGNGALLFLGGLWALGEQTPGTFERVYLVVFAILLLKTMFFLSRSAVHKQVQSRESMHVSGPAQGILLGLLAIFFAQVLAYLGTTIGGDMPDWIVSLSFATQTLIVMPIVLLAGGVAVIGVLAWIKKAHTEVWRKIAAPVKYVCEKSDMYVEVFYRKISIHEGVKNIIRYGDLRIKAGEERMATSPLKETTLIILACIVVSLIVLF